MKIILVTDWFSEKMGYSENCLAEALALEGHDVHLVTSTANVYCDDPSYDEIYRSFLGPPFVEPGTKNINNFTLHRLPILLRWKRLHIFKHLIKTIREIKPDIVQCYEATSSISLQLALTQPFLKFKLFTAIHTVASVYPAYYHYNKFNLLRRLRLRLFDTLLGKIISRFTTICYGATIDASEIGSRFFGIPSEKIKTDPLGVDTDAFNPVNNNIAYKEKRERMREKYGFKMNDIVCIYTGRFTIDKNPLILARAISILASKGEPFKGLFLGYGPQSEEIIKCKGCQVKPFVIYNQLPNYYRMADIGIWPRQESTSMIDAAASGVPIVVSDRMHAKERVDGNGLTYNENSLNDLVGVLGILSDSAIRKKLGDQGRMKMKKNFSWESIANKRIIDYQN